MIESMTGFGAGTATADGITASVELRSLNSRFVELNSRLPKSLQSRENDIKEILRRELQRGKINILVQLDRDSEADPGLRINEEAVKKYTSLLEKVLSVSGIKDTVRLEHILKFGDVFEASELSDFETEEWKLTTEALNLAIVQLKDMRKREGDVLSKDLRERIKILQVNGELVRKMSEERIPQERIKLRNKVAELISDEKINTDRLELEIVLLSERLDITEEITRLNSHLDYFLEALDGSESVGRKLNFLVQEMNREINTIGSKSNHADIARIVVQMKEELERIREQIQNLE